MTLVRTLFLGAMLLGVAAGGPAQAQDGRFAFRPVVETMVTDVIVPAHAALSAAAVVEVDAMDRLCTEPSAAGLDEAREAFRALVAAFGGVEAYRFGPAREDNRFERLFFWPDRRSRGLRQVEALLAEADPSALEVETLRQKSVAVQGLTALEYVLFGDGAEVLAQTDGFRCRYGAAVADAIAATAAEIEAGWRGPFGNALLAAGDGADGPYQSHGEVLKEILEAAAELLQIDADLKLGPAVIGETPGAGNPRLAPLWRSAATVPMLLANADAIAALAGPALESVLGDEAQAASQARFELAQVHRALDPIAGMDVVEAAADADAHKRLTYARIPLTSAQRLFAQRIPATFGFAAGFNALDGD